MDDNAIGALIYATVALVVAIISATIMRVKQAYWNMFDLYQFTLNHSEGTDVMAVAAMHNLMVQMFGNMI